MKFRVTAEHGNYQEDYYFATRKEAQAKQAELLATRPASWDIYIIEIQL